MKAKISPLMMLSVGLAVGIVVGYSLRERSLTFEERVFLNDHKAIVRMTDAVPKTQPNRQENGFAIQIPAPSLEKPEPFRREILLPDMTIRGGDRRSSSSDLGTHGDLLDLRYNPPQVELP
jgi:hypothetical protein